MLADGYLRVLEKNGDLVFEYRVPDEYAPGGNFRATFVDFGTGDGPLLAVLLFIYFDAELLNLFTLDGTLLYQEAVPPSGGFAAIGPEHEKLGGPALLLTRNPGIVVRYQWAGAAAEQAPADANESTAAPE